MISIRACANTLQPTNTPVSLNHAMIVEHVKDRQIAQLNEKHPADMHPLQLMIDGMPVEASDVTLHDNGAAIVASFEPTCFGVESTVVGLRRTPGREWRVTAVALCHRLEIPSDQIILAAVLFGDARFAYAL